MTEQLRGYYAIALTPFTSTGAILWDELLDECDWIARAGAHGVVWPVNNSEQTVLSFPERLQGIKVVVDAIGGRIPVMLGVADTSQAGAVALAENAAKVGADAVIALPPWHVKMSSRDLIRDYYQAIADAAGVPVCIQNLGGDVGSNLSGAFMAELCRDIPWVSYVKEERNPHGPNVDEVLAIGEPAMLGVFTGGQTLGLVDSHNRGACGNIASAELADVYAQIWDLMEEGDEARAREVQDAEAVMYKAVRSHLNMCTRKEVLVRRGIFTHNACRNLGSLRIDAALDAELEHALDVVAPYFRV